MIRNELLADLLAWLAATNAPLPSERNPDYSPDASAAPARRQRAKNKNKK